MKKRSLLLVASLIIAEAASIGWQAPKEYLKKVNPYAMDPNAVSAGRKLFERECSECHGAQAQGRGKAPALKGDRLAGSEPGAIFWVLRNGMMHRGMPSFAHLPEARRWQIITYLQSLNTQQSRP